MLRFFRCVLFCGVVAGGYGAVFQTNELWAKPAHYQALNLVGKEARTHRKSYKVEYYVSVESHGEKARLRICDKQWSSLPVGAKTINVLVAEGWWGYEVVRPPPCL